jgi:DNA-binding transcriptional ArsR family regulator
MGTGLDTAFAALSDATRRGVLEQLGRADASITDLAEKFRMTLTGMKKHVGVLEGSLPPRRSVACGRAGWARADSRKRRLGSRGTERAGTNVSTSWTRLSRN